LLLVLLLLLLLTYHEFAGVKKLLIQEIEQ
jgi:hypothetical protein